MQAEMLQRKIPASKQARPLLICLTLPYDPFPYQLMAHPSVIDALVKAGYTRFLLPDHRSSLSSDEIVELSAKTLQRSQENRLKIITALGRSTLETDDPSEDILSTQEKISQLDVKNSAKKKLTRVIQSVRALKSVEAMHAFFRAVSTSSLTLAGYDIDDPAFVQDDISEEHEPNEAERLCNQIELSHSKDNQDILFFDFMSALSDLSTPESTLCSFLKQFEHPDDVFVFSIQSERNYYLDDIFKETHELKQSATEFLSETLFKTLRVGGQLIINLSFGSEHKLYDQTFSYFVRKVNETIDLRQLRLQAGVLEKCIELTTDTPGDTPRIVFHVDQQNVLLENVRRYADLALSFITFLLRAQLKLTNQAIAELYPDILKNSHYAIEFVVNHESETICRIYGGHIINALTGEFKERYPLIPAPAIRMSQNLASASARLSTRMHTTAEPSDAEYRAVKKLR
ncbi:MAG: hypothetical protein V4490_07445 [Pseudomonadota bacterium]